LRRTLILRDLRSISPREGRDCNSAARLGTWTVTLTDPATGAKRDVKARYSFIYRYVDGDWKMDHLHSSAMPEPTS
jgi:hypothetical protein